MKKDNNSYLFSNMEFREIIITFTSLLLNKRYNAPEELKRALIKTHESNGIDTLTLLELLKAFKLESSQAINRNYKPKDLELLIDGLIKDSYISLEDYFILTALESLKGYITAQARFKKLESNRININLIDKDILKGILEEMQKL